MKALSSTATVAASMSARHSFATRRRSAAALSANPNGQCWTRPAQPVHPREPEVRSEGGNLQLPCLCRGARVLAASLIGVISAIAVGTASAVELMVAAELVDQVGAIWSTAR